MADDPVDVFLAVGSNVNPQEHILAALVLVKRVARITGVSTFYLTAPLGPSGPPTFLNGVWRIETSVGARELKFDHLRVVEAELDRVRTANKYAPRTIDLDIVIYGRAVIDEPDLQIPDPAIRTRAFVAIPVLELAPDLILPDTGERLAEIVGFERAGLRPAEEFSARLRQAAAIVT